jgi:iron uptake system component EfeO
VLPTFVIGLREGLEAALIVGIIASFLRRQGRRDLIRAVLAGVGAAVLVCVLVGIGLDAYSRDLPQRQQEGLETVIGLLAVALVTYMVVWMRRHSRRLTGQLEGRAAAALGDGARAGRAMVAMAFLAVIREGVETVVFLLAAFNESGSGAAAGLGALSGVLVAVGLGYGIYRGGVRLNLSRFFRLTGLVLVLVAGGILVNALHTAHEAGWLDVGQSGTVDLSWLVRPGTVLASLLTGMLGVQPQPVLIEIVGWLLYVIPVGWYVAWPPGKVSPARWLAPALAALTAAASIAAVVVLVPDRPGPAEALPADGSARPVREVAVTVTAARGCEPDATVLRAGAVTFTIRNVDATAVGEVELLSAQRIVAEKENLPPGFTGSFTATVAAGSYTLYCPGADPERRTLLVTGRAATTADDRLTQLLAGATKGYADYVERQVDALLVASHRLATALHGHRLSVAQRAYIAARPFYERIEPVAESFVIGTDSLDADLDARAGDVPAASWRGFHRIEKALFQTHTLAGCARYGELLVADVKRLQKLTAGLTWQPTDLANGAQELLDEVAASKITGEEERYSRIDVLDIANNVAGAQRAFTELRPALRHIDAELEHSVAAAFHALDTLVDTYRTHRTASGFVRYGRLSVGDKSGLAAAVKAVQEPLSRVAAKVGNG